METPNRPCAPLSVSGCMNLSDQIAKIKSEMDAELDENRYHDLAEKLRFLSLEESDKLPESPKTRSQNMFLSTPAQYLASRSVPIGDFAKEPIEGITFLRLAEPEVRIPEPPRFSFGNIPDHISARYFSSWGLSSAGVFVCENVVLAGEFLVGRDDYVFRSPELNIHPAHVEEAAARYAGVSARLLPRHVSGEHVVLAGPGFGVYGHWLVEYLPKLGLLALAGYDLAGLNYLMASNLPRFALEWLKLLGIKDSQIVFYDPVQEFILAERLLLPTILHNGVKMSDLFRTSANLLRGMILSSGDCNPPKADRRLFISRRKLGTARALLNRDRIEQMATKSGFELAYPEELSLVDQVKLFASARHVIGEYGSALHGTMFSKPGTIVCALRGNGFHPGFIQSGLGKVMEQPTGYVFGANTGTDLNATFSIPEDAFGTCLDLIFRGKIL